MGLAKAGSNCMQIELNAEEPGELCDAVCDNWGEGSGGQFTPKEGC